MPSCKSKIHFFHRYVIRTFHKKKQNAVQNLHSVPKNAHFSNTLKKL